MGSSGSLRAARQPASDFENLLTLLREMANLLCHVPSSRPPRHWTSDADAHGCLACNIPFDLLNRRHHCRCCGGVFCGSCSAERTSLPAGLTHGHGLAEEAERVCGACLPFAKELLPMLLAGDAWTLPIAKDARTGAAVVGHRHVSLSPDLASLAVRDTLPPPGVERQHTPPDQDSDTASCLSSSSSSSLSSVEALDEASRASTVLAEAHNSGTSVAAVAAAARGSSLTSLAQHGGALLSPADEVAVRLATVTDVQVAPPPLCGLSLKLSTAGGGRLLLQHTKNDQKTVEKWAAALNRLNEIRQRRTAAIRKACGGSIGGMGGGSAAAPASARVSAVATAPPATAPPQAPGAPQLPVRAASFGLPRRPVPPGGVDLRVVRAGSASFDSETTRVAGSRPKRLVHAASPVKQPKPSPNNKAKELEQQPQPPPVKPQRPPAALAPF